ncbi:Peptidase M15B and M15C DD-carboxypeptidase VanY/endolysin [Bacillus cereus Rock3-42]|nr:Peptidase M15B and M15C DD-carboxypeptidase VanY/endolysin [Bacillus cereus Rock3-42]
MRIKLVGIFTCMIVILGIFIVYTNQSIGKEPKKQTMKLMKTP